jgi:hypothetical protein
MQPLVTDQAPLRKYSQPDNGLQYSAGSVMGSSDWPDGAFSHPPRKAIRKKIE